MRSLASFFALCTLALGCSESTGGGDPGGAGGTGGVDVGEEGTPLAVAVPETGRAFVDLAVPAVITPADDGMSSTDWDLAFGGINAFTNGGTNSYKRLVPGFEAPVMLAYSARNRSASIRIPYEPSPKGKRIEVRFPDPSANPYLAFAAMLMAGLDGIQNKIHPGDPADKDLYDLPPEEGKKIPTVASSLEMALEALDKDREYLTRGGVFSDDMIDAYIELKMGELDRLRMTTHPIEFEMYYSA